MFGFSSAPPREYTTRAIYWRVVGIRQSELEKAQPERQMQNRTEKKARTKGVQSALSDFFKKPAKYAEPTVHQFRTPTHLHASSSRHSFSSSPVPSVVSQPIPLLAPIPPLLARFCHRIEQLEGRVPEADPDHPFAGFRNYEGSVPEDMWAWQIWDRLIGNALQYSQEQLRPLIASGPNGVMAIYELMLWLVTTHKIPELTFPHSLGIDAADREGSGSPVKKTFADPCERDERDDEMDSAPPFTGQEIEMEDPAVDEAGIAIPPSPPPTTRKSGRTRKDKRKRNFIPDFEIGSAMLVQESGLEWNELHFS
ncbi:hypothetical protein K438DRAFT_1777348 [Mycena galopus ATCC 62051]|nr:hypothetical protein K438DRAFT_1777348 [Mycena galopus ATCC 62051]